MVKVRVRQCMMPMCVLAKYTHTFVFWKLSSCILSSSFHVCVSGSWFMGNLSWRRSVRCLRRSTTSERSWNSRSLRYVYNSWPLTGSPFLFVSYCQGPGLYVLGCHLMLDVQHEMAAFVSYLTSRLYKVKTRCPYLYTVIDHLYLQSLIVYIQTIWSSLYTINTFSLVQQVTDLSDHFPVEVELKSLQSQHSSALLLQATPLLILLSASAIVHFFLWSYSFRVIQTNTAFLTDTFI